MKLFESFLRAKERRLVLFSHLCSQQKIWNAQIVGKNIFCENPSDKTAFTRYFDFCIEQALKQEDLNSCSFFVNESELALSLFCERCDMSETMLDIIDGCRSRLLSTRESVNNKFQKETEANALRIVQRNDNTINELDATAGLLKGVTNQVEFDTLINKVSELENSLDKPSFTPQQQEKYNTITRAFSDLITEKMREFQHQKDVDYNLKAVKVFKEVYDTFKKEGNKYKKGENDFKGLIANSLCGFDGTRLFSETSMYYNFVYSYIFNTVGDELKIKMTEFAITSDRKQ